MKWKRMMKYKRLAILFLLCLMFFSACGTVENESNETEDLYDKFLNGA